MPTQSTPLGQQQPSHPPTVAERHAEQLSEIRQHIFNLLDRSHQLDVMQASVGAYAAQYYANAPQALEKIRAHIEYIFSVSGVQRNFHAPKALEALLGSTPCM
jgi:hypothetical protein